MFGIDWDGDGVVDVFDDLLSMEILNESEEEKNKEEKNEEPEK